MVLNMIIYMSLSGVGRSSGVQVRQEDTPAHSAIMGEHSRSDASMRSALSDNDFVDRTGSTSQRQLPVPLPSISVLASRKSPASHHPCPGYTLDHPLGRSPYGSYPFGLHVGTSLPWNVSVNTSHLVLCAISCTGWSVSSSECVSCKYCAALASNSVLQGIQGRMRDGIHENTPFQFHPYDSTVELLRRKNAQLEGLRFDKLNHARRYLSRGRTLKTYKRFVMSVSHSDLHARVHKVVSVARRNCMSINAIVDKLDRANKRLYSSRSYDEIDFQRSFPMLKLGGQRAADIGAWSMGLPSLSATRRWNNIHPLIASSGAPTAMEMSQNLQSCLPLPPLNDSLATPPEARSVQSPTPYIILVDEIKLEERFRWDPGSNMILGVCQEHGNLCSLEFRSREEVHVLGELLCSKAVHAASEVSVVTPT